MAITWLQLDIVKENNPSQAQIKSHQLKRISVSLSSNKICLKLVSKVRDKTVKVEVEKELREYCMNQ